MNADPRRTHILEVAVRRFDHFGYRKTTMAEIARDAGVSVGALYLIFKSKEEILLANAEHRFCQLLGEMREASRQPIPPSQKLEQVIRARVFFLNRLCTSSTHGEELVCLLKDQLNELYRRLHQQQLELLEEVLREGREIEHFQVEDIPSTAACCHAAFTAYIPPFSRGLSEQQLARGVAIMTRLLLDGLRSR